LFPLWSTRIPAALWKTFPPSKTELFLTVMPLVLSAGSAWFVSGPILIPPAPEVVDLVADDRHVLAATGELDAVTARRGDDAAVDGAVRGEPEVNRTSDDLGRLLRSAVVRRGPRRRRTVREAPLRMAERQPAKGEVRDRAVLALDVHDLRQRGAMTWAVSICSPGRGQ